MGWDYVALGNGGSMTAYQVATNMPHILKPKVGIERELPVGQNAFRVQAVYSGAVGQTYDMRYLEHSVCM